MSERHQLHSVPINLIFLSTSKRWKDLGCPIALRRNTRKLDSLERLWVAFAQQTNQFTKSAAEPTRRRQSIELDSIKTLSVYGLGYEPAASAVIDRKWLASGYQSLPVWHCLRAQHAYIYYCRMCNLCLDLFTLFTIPYWFGRCSPGVLPRQHNFPSVYLFFSLLFVFFFINVPPCIEQILRYMKVFLTCIMWMRLVNKK